MDNKTPELAEARRLTAELRKLVEGLRDEEARKIKRAVERRAKRNAYMKHYMRERRAKAKAAQKSQDGEA